MGRDAREVTYKNDNLAALTIVGEPVTVTEASSTTYTVALTKAYGGVLSISSDDTGYSHGGTLHLDVCGGHLQHGADGDRDRCGQRQRRHQPRFPPDRRHGRRHSRCRECGP